MNFLFVDRVDAIEGDSIRGTMRFDSQSPWRTVDGSGRWMIPLGLISEGVGQLVSWLALKQNNFSYRPVFLFVRVIELDGIVRPGSKIEMHAEIIDRKEDSFIFSGKAYCDGQQVVSIKECGGYFMPLSQLEDPMVSRQRFLELTHPPDQVTRLVAPEHPYDFSKLIEQDVIPTAGRIEVTKIFSIDEPFFKDHFPRFPVTPIVILNELIGRACVRILENESKFRLFGINDLKIKSFVKPGDALTIRLQRIESDMKGAEIFVEGYLLGKRMLCGRYKYQRLKSERVLGGI